MRARLLGFGFLAATLLRLWLGLVARPPGDFLYSDMGSYQQAAVRLLAFDTGPVSTFRPLGYPAALALLYLGGPHTELVAVVQALLGAGLGLLGASLARRLTQSTTAEVIVFVALALYPPYLHYGALVMTELPSAFLFTLAVHFLLQPGTRRARWGAALALAGATVMRPNFLLLYPLLLLWFRHEGPWRAALARWAHLLAVSALLFLPFCLHNSLQLGRPTGLATNGGLNFYLARAEVRGVLWQEGGRRMQVGPIANWRAFTRIEVSPVPLWEESYFYRRGLAQITEDPALLLTSLGNVRDGLGLGPLGYWPEVPGWTPLLDLCNRAFVWLLLLPSVAGMILVRRARAAWDLGAIALGSALASMYLYLGDPRIHVPFDALLLVLAVAGATRLSRRLFRPRPA